MGINPVNKTSISNQVFDQMKNNIISGEWKPGTKIPSEVNLAQMFEASRISIRQAIHRLCGMGILDIKIGDGTYLTDHITSDYFGSLLPILMIDKVDVAEVLEFRYLFEPSYMKLTVEKINNEEIESLEKIIENMVNSKGDIAEFSKNDLKFHLYLALATKNGVIIKINSILFDLLSQSLKKIVAKTGFDDGIYYHSLLLKYIKDRNATKVTSIMKEHITKNIKKLNYL